MLPELFKERMKQDLGEAYDAFIAEYDKPPYRGFRVNTLKLSPERLLELFPYSTGKVPWCENGFYYDIRAGRHLCSRCGLIYSQEPSAMAPVELLDPKPGDRVLDLCAAPGGKSTQIATKLRSRGLLVANEIIPSRASILAENIERMGIVNAVVTNMSPEKMEGLFPLFFDKILVDAPCSGEGMFRRDEIAVTEWSPEHTRSCSVRQLSILHSAIKMLRDGGELVYSTCTFSRDENENVCERLTGLCPEMDLVKTKRLMPHTHKGEGHFAAKFVKRGAQRLDRPPLAEKCDISLYRRFENESLSTALDGAFAVFGEKLFLVPDELGSLKGIKAVRPGLYLGDNKKGRFEPAHHLCMALKKEDFRQVIELDEATAMAYYAGDTVPCEDGKGYTAVTWEGFPLGWGKISNGTVKNHIPKYLRG